MILWINFLIEIYYKNNASLLTIPYPSQELCGVNPYHVMFMFLLSDDFSKKQMASDIAVQSDGDL